MNLSAEQREQLAEIGFIHLPQTLDGEQLERLRDHLEYLWEKEGENAGSENYMEANTRRLANLADKGDIFRPIYAHPYALEACKLVMGDDVRVSMLNARDALPNTGARQLWHCDTDDSGTPENGDYYACTAIWMIDDFTEANGATYLVPKTHLTGKVPKQVMEDRYAAHPDEIRATGRAGDLFIFNGHVWHAGGANESDASRRALLVHYMRKDHIPERGDRRQHLSAETVQTLTDKELTLLGYHDDYGMGS